MSGSEMINRLSGGWPPERGGVADDFMRLWFRKMQVACEDIAVEKNLASCNQAMDSVKLRNFSSVQVLLLGGAIKRKELLEWRERAMSSSVTSQLCVLAGTDVAFLEAEAVFPSGQENLVIEPEALAAILDSHEPVQVLKSLTRQRLSAYRLNPFGILRAPSSNMFAGRQHELGLLQHSNLISYALAGPGRIGKTSLVHQLFGVNYFFALTTTISPGQRQLLFAS
jgi:hypothetical protein